MSSTMRGGTDGAKHFHVWRASSTSGGEIKQLHRQASAFKSQSQARQWLHAPGRRGLYFMIRKCFDEGCRARHFEAPVRRVTVRAPERLTREFVDGVSTTGRYFDGDSLSLSVWETKSGQVNKTWVMYFRPERPLHSGARGPPPSLVSLPGARWPRTGPAQHRDAALGPAYRRTGTDISAPGTPSHGVWESEECRLRRQPALPHARVCLHIRGRCPQPPPPLQAAR